MSLKQRYYQDMQTKLKSELGIANSTQIPRLTKIVVNVGVGAEVLKDKKVLEIVSAQVAHITGQKPQITRAKVSIATFKLRIGMPIGVKVTLRGARMYDFFEKMVTIVFTRVRDFRGVSRNGLDGRGNYSLGFREQIVFPEIEYSKIDKIRGLEVTFVTTATDNRGATALLTHLGMPFEKQNA